MKYSKTVFKKWCATDLQHVNPVLYCRMIHKHWATRLLNRWHSSSKPAKHRQGHLITKGFTEVSKSIQIYHCFRQRSKCQKMRDGASPTLSVGIAPPLIFCQHWPQPWCNQWCKAIQFVEFLRVAVLMASPVPSPTWSNDCFPIGKDTVLRWVPLLIQQYDLQTTPKWAKPPIAKLQMLHTAKRIPCTLFKLWVSDRSVSKALAWTWFPKAEAIDPTPAKNSMQWRVSNASLKQQTWYPTTCQQQWSTTYVGLQSSERAQKDPLVSLTKANTG